MTRSSQTPAEWAHQLLALEAEHDGEPDDHAGGAARVHDKLLARMSPLLGPAGVQALLARSARLASARFPRFADPTVADSPTALRACLQAETPAVAREMAAALFGPLFSLLGTFIGPRLTNQLLRGTWPSLPAFDSEETDL